MDKYLLFADYLSVLPLVYVVIICIYYTLSAIDIVPSVFSERYILGYFVSIFLAQLIKYILYPLFDFAKRPQGARGCDYHSRKGDCSGKPGCPSGHMSTTAYFVVFNLLILNKTNYIKSPLNKQIFTSLNIGLLLLMGWARYYKLCHSICQIILGSLLGAFLAWIFF
jgi:hypothetical protein